MSRNDQPGVTTFYRYSTRFLIPLLFAIGTVGLSAQLPATFPDLEEAVFQAGYLRQIAVVTDSDTPTYRLVWHGTFAPHILPFTTTETAQLFTIPAALSQKAGIVDLDFYSKDQLIGRRQFYIAAGEATGVIESYIGPKTVNLDTLQPILSVDIARDALRNPIESGSPVAYSILFPQTDKPIAAKARTENLVSYLLIEPTAKTGKIVVGARTGQARSNEQEARIEAGVSTDFQLRIVEQPPFADGHQQTIVAATDLRDRLGNPVADGTLVAFRMTAPDRIADYTAAVVNGRATLAFLNPDRAETITVEARVAGGGKSRPLDLTYKTTIAELPVVYERNKLEVGPVSSRLGHLFTSGKTVAFYFPINRRTIERPLINGRASLDLLSDVDFDATEETVAIIRLAGLERTLQLKAP